MNISRKLGVLIFCGVPAIVSGGIVYALFDSYGPVVIYESILLLVAVLPYRWQWVRVHRAHIAPRGARI